MLTVNVMINVMIIGQPPVTAIFRWRARLAYESTFTVMDSISGTTLLSVKKKLLFKGAGPGGGAFNLPSPLLKYTDNTLTFISNFATTNEI